MSGASPGLGYSTVQTGGVKFTPRGLTTSGGTKRPPGPGQIIRLPGPSGSSPSGEPLEISSKIIGFLFLGFTQRSSFVRQSFPEKDAHKTPNDKENFKNKRGF